MLNYSICGAKFKNPLIFQPKPLSLSPLSKAFM
jgi:hypothetical protein